jgi:hypothetical protein
VDTCEKCVANSYKGSEGLKLSAVPHLGQECFDMYFPLMVKVKPWDVVCEWIGAVDGCLWWLCTVQDQPQPHRHCEGVWSSERTNKTSLVEHEYDISAEARTQSSLVA